MNKGVIYIPGLPEILESEGCIVTIGAMGCQKEIAGQIREKGADYILALKCNHGNLYEDVRLFFEDAGYNRNGNIGTSYQRQSGYGDTLSDTESGE